MNTSIANHLQTIIQNRQEYAQAFKAEHDFWTRKTHQFEEINSHLRHLRSTLNNGNATETEKAVYNELGQAGLLNPLEIYKTDVNHGLEILARAAKRFERKTINIAVAGESRCGKSTSLKSILGLDIADNQVIRSGEGTAMTASKHILCNIPAEENEKTVVHWHTEESFISNVIQPMLQALSGEDVDISALCTSILDLEKYVDTEELRRRVPKSEENNNILDQLAKIKKALPSFKHKLVGGETIVPVAETSRYTSHPQMRDDYEDISYAVRECRTYCHFPNNDVFSLQVTDLPGLGTCDITEQQCFLHGFDMSVDLALLVRRPVANGQNFPNQNDRCVRKELENCMGYDLLPYSALFFQNDANIHDGDAEIAYQAMMDILRTDRQPLQVIRGDGKNRSFMQNELMPQLLNFMVNNLPKADEALWKKYRRELQALKNDIRRIDEELIQALARVRKLLPCYNEGDAIHTASKAMRRKFSVKLDDYRKFFETPSAGGQPSSPKIQKCNEAIKNKIDTLSKELGQDFDKSLDRNSAEAVERVREELSIQDHQADMCAAEMLQDARVQLSEKFSELEHVYNHILDDVRDDVYHCFYDVIGNAIPQKGNLCTLKNSLDQYGNCTTMADALGHLLEVRMPFYSVIYPDLRENVFENMKVLKEHFRNAENPSQILHLMREITLQWTQDAREALYSQGHIFRMISAQLERFQDQMTRNPTIENEWRHLVEHNPCLYMNEENVRMAQIRQSIDGLETIIRNCRE